MDIRSAIIQAKKFGGVIKRGEIYFYPTDDFGRTIIYNEDGKIISPGWEPCLKDLIASDWKVSLLKFKKPTKRELSKWGKELIENPKPQASKDVRQLPDNIIQLRNFKKIKGEK